MHKICKKYMHKYANICNLYAKICKYMQHSLCHRNMQKYAKICKVYACYMQKHAKYAITFFICRICKNMHSPLCWWRSPAKPAGRPGARFEFSAGAVRILAVTYNGIYNSTLHGRERAVASCRMPLREALFPVSLIPFIRRINVGVTKLESEIWV
jgi:hypothetical protein